MAVPPNGKPVMDAIPALTFTLPLGTLNDDNDTDCGAASVMSATAGFAVTESLSALHPPWGQAESFAGPGFATNRAPGSSLSLGRW